MKETDMTQYTAADINDNIQGNYVVTSLHEVIA